MNTKQFQDWWADYCVCFPDTATWMNSNAGKGVATLREWKSVFDQHAVDLDDAKQVARLMLKGSLDRVPAFEREMTATVVAREASKMSYERKSSRVESRRSVERFDVDDPTICLGGIYQKIIDAQAQGLSTDEVIAKVFSGHSEDRRDRYRCAMCLDTGLVNCVSARTVRDLLDVAGGGPISLASASCKCSAGDRHRNRKDFKGRPASTPTYDPTQHVRFKSKEQARADCKQLAEEVASRPLEGRESCFDEYNNR